MAKEYWITIKQKGNSIDLFGIDDIDKSLAFARMALLHGEEVKVEIDAIEKEEDFLDDVI